MRIPALNTLLKDLAASPRPVRSFEHDGKRFRLEFEPLAPTVRPVEAAKPEQQPELIPGTTIPVGKEPLHPFDLVINPPTILPDAQ